VLYYNDYYVSHEPDENFVAVNLLTNKKGCKNIVVG